MVRHWIKSPFEVKTFIKKEDNLTETEMISV